MRRFEYCLTFDGESGPRGHRMFVIIRERGKRTRTLKARWRADTIPQRAFYLSRLELGTRLANEGIL